jgi:hypothetical protein
MTSENGYATSSIIRGTKWNITNILSPTIVKKAEYIRKKYLTLSIIRGTVMHIEIARNLRDRNKPGTYEWVQGMKGVINHEDKMITSIQKKSLKKPLTDTEKADYENLVSQHKANIKLLFKHV